MSKPVTLGQLVEYVLKYRKGNAFKDHLEHQIASGIKLASDSGTMLYCCRDDGTVCGIITCFEDAKNKVMYVNDALTTQKWVLSRFVTYFKHTYPDYILAARRKGNQVVYEKTDKLCNRLMKGNI